MADEDAVSIYTDATGHTFQMTKADAERAGLSKQEPKRGPGRPRKDADEKGVTPDNKAVTPDNK